eukprot:470702_1
MAGLGGGVGTFLTILALRYAWVLLREVYEAGYSTQWSCESPIVNDLDIQECFIDFYSRNYRTLSGKCNNLEYPLEGSSGAHFTRIGRDFKHLIPEPDDIDIYEPNPYDIAKELLHTKPDKPPNIETHVNLLLPAWAQFIVHDQVGHEKFDINDNPHQIVSDSLNHTMNISRQKPSDNPTTGCPYKQFKNTKTAYFDGSALYGMNEDIHNGLMDDVDPRKFKLEYIPEYDEYQLPYNVEKNEYIVGETGNFWPGLNIYHLLFAQEHNYIIDKLDKIYLGEYSDEEKYHIARLIIAAFIAKTHITELVPVVGSTDREWMKNLLLENDVISEYIKDNFYTDNLDNFPWSLDLWLKLTDLMTQKTEHVPYQKTEMFDAMYTLHNIVQENIYFRHYSDSNANHTETISFRDIHFMENTKNINSKYSMKDILYSFGTLNHPSKIELNSYPESFTHFETSDGHIVDLATVDLIRTRERGLPKYTAMRKILRLPEITSYRQLTNDDELINKLKSFYNTIHDMDLLIGMYLENTG